MIKMTAIATNKMDLSTYSFYIEKGQEFDIAQFEESYNVKLSENNIKFVKQQLEKLNKKYLLVSFTQ